MRLVFLCLFLGFFACRTLPTQAGKAGVKLVHTFRGEKFALDTPYITLLGDTVVFTKFKYYWHILPPLAEGEAQFQLIDLEQTAHTEYHLQTKKTPKNTQKIAFGIGIDSIYNTKNSQKGALDPLKGMFWTWAQGYAFLKAEGYFSPNSTKRMSFVLHIGSNENYQKLAYPTQTTQIQVQIEKLFGGYEGAGIEVRKSEKPLSLMAGERVKLLKINIQKMFEN